METLEKRGLGKLDLASEEAFVIEEAVGVGDAGGVAFAGSAEIGDGGGAEGGVGGEGVEEQVVKERREKRGGTELISEVKRQRTLERRVREDRRVEVARQSRLRLGVAARLRLDLPPHPPLFVRRH